MDSNYSRIILNRILSLCKKRGITINGLAAMSGLRQSTIQNIVCGSSKNPKIATLHKIAIALSMTLAEFLDYPELNDYSFDDAEDEQTSFQDVE